MDFRDYDPEETLEYYIQDETMLAELSKGELLNQIEELFLEDSGYGPYKEAMFLSFLLYTTGDYKRMRVVVERLYRILKKEYIPDTPETFLSGWFENKVPDGAATDPSVIENRFIPILKEVKQKVHDRAVRYVQLIMEDFTKFFALTEDELFLASREIHSEELTDKEMEDSALRWEYKYLGREPKKISERWKIYLERQDECPK